ncbi:hypothetical protein B0H13DRAFT_2319700 [Mycena leptocephala]|nr:hypothetical protein B0H13DRAFT_2319700 [Mycena leptocephala]
MTGFQISAQPAYWSLDPSGANRLSGKVAEDLGFPAIQVEMYAHVQSWDVSIYDGICQFHEAKGFNLFSQEVAIELGSPLLQVLCDRDALLAQMKENDPRDCYLESDGAPHTEDCFESGDEQFDSDDSPIQEVDIESVFCGALENQHEFIPTVNESLSSISEQYLESGNQCCAPEEAALLAPCRSLNITMSVRFALIVTAITLSLYDYVHPRS